MVEHDVGGGPFALGRRVRCWVFGERIAVGSPEVIRTDPAVRAAYLGDTDLRGFARRADSFSVGRLGMTEHLLAVENLDVRYGLPPCPSAAILLSVEPGAVLAVLGVTGPARARSPAISGLVPPTLGRVVFDGHDITGAPAHRIREKLERAPHPGGPWDLPWVSGLSSTTCGWPWPRREAAPRPVAAYRPGHRPLPRAGPAQGTTGREPRVVNSRCSHWPGPSPCPRSSSSWTRCRWVWRRS